MRVPLIAIESGAQQTFCLLEVGVLITAIGEYYADSRSVEIGATNAGESLPNCKPEKQVSL